MNKRDKRDAEAVCQSDSSSHDFSGKIEIMAEKSEHMHVLQKNINLAESLVFESGSLQTSAAVRQLVLEGINLKKKMT